MRLFRRKSDRVPTTPCLIKLSSPIGGNGEIGKDEDVGERTAAIGQDTKAGQQVTVEPTESVTKRPLPNGPPPVVRPNKLNLNLRGNNRGGEAGTGSPKTPIRKGKLTFKFKIQ